MFLHSNLLWKPICQFLLFSSHLHWMVCHHKQPSWLWIYQSVCPCAAVETSTKQVLRNITKKQARCLRNHKAQKLFTKTRFRAWNWIIFWLVPVKLSRQIYFSSQEKILAGEMLYNGHQIVTPVLLEPASTASFVTER